MSMPSLHDHACDIRSLREQSNLAIAARDAARVVSFMTHDVIVRVAGGPALRGAEASHRAFVEQFAERAFCGYERTPDSVEIVDAHTRATERGNWVGRWQSGVRLQEQRGRYTAEWTLTLMGWRIRAETFVELS